MNCNMQCGSKANIHRRGIDDKFFSFVCIVARTGHHREALHNIPSTSVQHILRGSSGDLGRYLNDTMQIAAAKFVPFAPGEVLLVWHLHLESSCTSAWWYRCVVGEGEG